MCLPRDITNTPDVRHDNHLGILNGIRIGETISRRGMREKRKKQKEREGKHRAHIKDRMSQWADPVELHHKVYVVLLLLICTVMVASSTQ